MRTLALLTLFAALSAAQQDRSVATLTGTLINTTKRESPLAANAQITMSLSQCTLTISPPLIGSGACRLKQYNKSSGTLEIVSSGSPAIDWIGTVKGNLASGSYTIASTGETGSFYLVLTTGTENEPQLSQQTPPLPARNPRSLGGSCTTAIESAISGDIEGWDGETIFKLDNGQIWQQARYSYYYFYAFHPDVTIYPTSDGCTMKVEDESETVVVKRIK